MQESHIELEKFIEGLPVGVIILNPDLSVRTGNTSAFKLLGIEVEDLLQGNFDAIVKDAEMKNALAAIGKKDAGKQDFFLKRDTRIIKCTASTLKPESDKDGAIVILFEDATRFRQLESMKQEFMQTILHRIRSPLATLKTSLSIISSEKIAKLPLAIKEILDMSSHEVNRLNVLLGDLRNLYTIETGIAEKEIAIEEFAVADVLDRALGDFFKLYGNNEELEKRFSSKGDINAFIKADFEKLKQVLIILLKNAHEFSINNPIIQIITSQNSGQVAIEVKDNGIGIAEDKKDLVFTKFFREDNEINRNREGNGLGLFIARSLIELMKGTMYYESKKGIGSSFFINLQSSQEQ